MRIQILGTLAALTFINTSPSQPSSGSVVVKKQVYVATTVCPCEYNFVPVCGSDGVTYYNKCLLDCANDQNKQRNLPTVYAVDDSKCTGCNCQDIDFPVCTLDGYTYPNECLLTCDNMRYIQEKQNIIYLGYRTACIGTPCSCSTVAAPVCGTDNVLYRNKCVLECTSTNAKDTGYRVPIEFKNNGGCLDGCRCPAKEEPVCGSDGRVYDNLCFLACQNRMISYTKYPQVSVANNNICDTCDCPSYNEFVCGGDGKTEPRTFRNPCEMKCIADRSNARYEIMKYGPCPKCSCTGVSSPVCGTDLKTYQNECSLRCANENLPKGKSVSIFYRGACKECDCSRCSGDYAPLCGSDDETYWNLCWLNCNNTCRKLKGLPAISKAREGSCRV